MRSVAVLDHVKNGVFINVVIQKCALTAPLLSETLTRSRHQGLGVFCIICGLENISVNLRTNIQPGFPLLPATDRAAF